MLRQRRTVAAVLGVAVAVLGIAASSGTAAHKTTYHIALVTGDNHDPFYVTMNQGAQAMAKKLGVTVNWQGPATFEAAPLRSFSCVRSHNNSPARSSGKVTDRPSASSMTTTSCSTPRTALLSRAAIRPIPCGG